MKYFHVLAFAFVMTLSTMSAAHEDRTARTNQVGAVVGYLYDGTTESTVVGAVIGAAAGAAVGAVAGSLAGGVGAVPGAIAGAAAGAL
ncbi:MAG TPA: hypothetical protein VFV34_26945 [Blastocatellia bacterium]|nr:hypothetical protein [Blastocatellia bacterium]